MLLQVLTKPVYSFIRESFASRKSSEVSHEFIIYAPKSKWILFRWVRLFTARPRWQTPVSVISIQLSSNLSQLESILILYFQNLREIFCKEIIFFKVWQRLFIPVSLIPFNLIHNYYGFLGKIFDLVKWKLMLRSEGRLLIARPREISPSLFIFLYLTIKRSNFYFEFLYPVKVKSMLCKQVKDFRA